VSLAGYCRCKARLRELRRRIDPQALTDVNDMLFKILATPDR